MAKLAIQNRQHEIEVRAVRSAFCSVGELDELRELAHGASIEIAQLSPGNMQGMLAHVDLGPSSVHMNRFSLPARGWGALAPSRCTCVVFPKSVDGRFNGYALSDDILMFYPPGTQFEGTIAHRFQDWVFTVECDELASARRALAHRDTSIAWRTPRLLAREPGLVTALREFAITTLRAMSRRPALLDDARVRLALHARLVDLVARALESAIPEVERRRQAHPHSEVVSRAENYLAAQLDQPVSITDMCKAARVSERTLRNAFLSVTDLTPSAYLRTIRLNRARVELEQVAASTATVTDVAFRWGFTHLGRFAQDYRQFFGELPSETLVKTNL